MPFDPNDRRIDDLERDLYSRDAPSITQKQRPSLTPFEDKEPSSWKGEEMLAHELAEVKQGGGKGSFVTKIFAFSVIFFLVAAGIAAYMVLGGFNIISSKNVDISVQGLIAVSAGEELALDIIVTNNNNTALENAILYVEYPPGTRKAGNINEELIRDQIDIGLIGSRGGRATKTVKAVLFGEKDSVQQIKITVDYNARGSNASFSKQKTYDIAIKSSPVLVSVDVPKEVNAGQEIVLTINVTSNSATLVRDLLVRAEYPFGFTFASANPAPTFDNNVWKVGDLNPKEKRTYVIRGKMEGQNEEERTFRFNVGTAKETDEKQISVTYISLIQSLSIKKPFVTLTLGLDNTTSGDFISKIDSQIRGSLGWANNLPITLNDASIEVKLSGQGLDKSKVTVEQKGFYQSSSNTITWDKNDVPELKTIGPGDSGFVNFSLNTLPNNQQTIAQGRNMEINLDIVLKGTRVQNNVPQEVRSETTRKIKIASYIDVNARSLYTVGPFVNKGPIPPKAEVETTYTIIWTLSNTFNDIANAYITAQLPPYVKWLNTFSPSGEKVTYNESTRMITWNVGDVKAGTGYSTSPREVALQVSFTPSLSQVSTAPLLMGEVKASATDRFTQTTVESSKTGPSTKLSTDPTYNVGDENVIN